MCCKGYIRERLSHFYKRSVEEKNHRTPIPEGFPEYNGSEIWSKTSRGKMTVGGDYEWVLWAYFNKQSDIPRFSTGTENGS
jgi:hypothetical protein